MERARWTDERIEDRMVAMDDKFDRLIDELHALRTEFSLLRTEFSLLRTEVRAEIASVRGDLWTFQRQVTLIVAGLAVGLLGLLGALVAAQF